VVGSENGVMGNLPGPHKKVTQGWFKDRPTRQARPACSNRTPGIQVANFLSLAMMCWKVKSKS
jgi:hypothetical protein